MLKRQPHPGTRLRKEYFEPRGLTVTDVAKQLGVTRQALNNIVNGKSGISPKMAVSLAIFFGLEPETVQQWQKEYELSQARTERAKRVRSRGYSFLLTSNDLVAWAETIDARYALPLLLRALIRVTSESAFVDFPAREDVQKPGWDGVVRNPRRGSYVPSGTSVWELSTEARVQPKVEQDYQKRTQNPLNFQPKTSTLVMVTLRRWAQKKQWAEDKQQLGEWARVIAYDATDLEQWLELAPEVAIWLATRIGRRPAGVRSLDSFWSEFSASTTPAMSPALLLAGRGEEAGRVAEWLSAGSGVLRVLADSGDEGLAFIAAVAASRQEASIQSAMTDTIVVDDTEQARQLMVSSRRLTFGWQIDDPSLLGALIDKGHRALVPIGRSAAGVEHADVELRRLNREEFMAAIKDTLPGQDDQKRGEEANTRVWESGRSITVYRRRYAAAGIARIPVWAQPNEAGELIPVLLAGGWSESSEADKAVLAALAGADYLQVSRMLARYRNQADSPIRRIGDAWSLVAPLDAWSLLSKYITDIELQRYREAVLEVLGEKDPALEVEPGERWLANLYDKERKHSNALRRGLADSLILLAVVGDKSGPNTSMPVRNFCEGLVAELLGRHPSAEMWASLFDLLPSLAEAAPDAFLSILEDDLAAGSAHKAPEVIKLFEVEDRPLGGSARHPHLLWALEQLAWEPEYMPRSARILAKLSRLDPGGNLRNRPRQSLVGIFCCWYPNTAATLDARLTAIDSLLTREAQVSWDLLLELLPTDHGVGHTSSEPRWRAKPEKTSLTWGDIWRSYDEVITRTLDAAQIRCDRLCQLVDRIRTWRPEQRMRLVQQIHGFEKACKDPQERQTMWREIRDFVGYNRTYRFLEEADTLPFEELLGLLASDDIVGRYTWLFDDDMPALTTPAEVSTADIAGVERRMKEVERARESAVSDVMKEQGVNGLLSLARQSKLSGAVGSSVAAILSPGPAEYDILDRTLAAADPRVSHAGVCFVWRRKDVQPPTWADGILQSDVFRSWSAEKKAAFCLGLTEGPSTWAIVSNLGEAVEKLYWGQATVILVRLSSNEDAEFAVRKLVETAGRALNALDQAGFQPDRLSAPLLVRVLDAAIEELAKLKKLHIATVDHDVQRILERLRTGGELSHSELGRLELQYLPLLQPFYRPVTLYKSLQEDPELFAEVVAYAFRPDEDSPTPSPVVELDDDNDAARNRARLAWELLSKWDRVPGSGPNGSLNEGDLKRWFARARAACAAKGRSRIGDIQIGRMLAHAVPEADGIWPPRAVRDLIEDAESRDLESGLHSGRISQRGVYTKSPSEGGRPERELAKRYKTAATSVNAHWQRTARLLNSLAETYESFGRNDDISAERMGFI